MCHSSQNGMEVEPPLTSYSCEEIISIGVDIMDLPLTENGNKHVVVFKGFLTKWPLVFPVPNQLAIVVARL